MTSTYHPSIIPDTARIQNRTPTIPRWLLAVLVVVAVAATSSFVTTVLVERTQSRTHIVRLPPRIVRVDVPTPPGGHYEFI